MLNYEEREKIKAVYRPIIEAKDLPMFYRVEAAEHVIDALFNRSCESYLKQRKRFATGDPLYEAIQLGHPDNKTYRRMLLNQGSKALLIPQAVYYALLTKHGKEEGISSGTYFTA